MVDAVVEAVQASARATTRQEHRATPLVGLPPVATGGGGLAGQRGTVLRLLARLEEGDVRPLGREPLLRGALRLLQQPGQPGGAAGELVAHPCRRPVDPPRDLCGREAGQVVQHDDLALGRGQQLEGDEDVRHDAVTV